MPVITALKRMKFHKDRFNLFVEKEFVAMVPDYLVAKFQLKSGVDVPRDILGEIVEEAEKFRASEAAYRYLTRRPHSVFELRMKLKKKGFSGGIIKSAIDKCLENGYLDDEKFAIAWVKSRLAAKPRGRKMLMAELYSKGVDREISKSVVDQALAETSEDELALKLLHKNRNRLMSQNSVDLRHKIYNFLSYRGFGFQAIHAAADEFIKNIENEDDQIDEKL